MGSGAAPRKILVLDPMLGWADPPMVLCMIFAHVFWTRWFSVHGIGRDGFRSMVLDASACINMYCNIERNIMKNQAGSLSFGIQRKISVYMCFMCYALALFIFCVLEFVSGNFCTRLKPPLGIRVVLASRGRLCC